MHVTDFLRCQNFHSESSGLGDGAAREVVAAKAHGETEIILDARTAPGLPSRSFALDEQRVQSVRRAVHRCCQSRRTRTNDNEIVKRELRFRFQPQLARYFSSRRIAQK